MPEAPRTGSVTSSPARNPAPGKLIHNAWLASAVLTVVTGLLHLFNLIEAGRASLGPLLVTPFRAAFVLSWVLLLADYAYNRRRPRFNGADAIVAFVALIFLARAALATESFVITVNWVITGAGVFYLIKHGIRERADACVVLAGVAAAALILTLFGLFEYAFKSNPLFNNVQVKVVGADTRIAASDQFYRIRSLIGHPGFAAAVLLSSLPVVLMIFWRRRWLAIASGLLISSAIFLTFSRGSWLVALVVLIPLAVFYGRAWIKSRYKWLVLVAALIALLVAWDYWSRDEVSVSLAGRVVSQGISPLAGNDGGFYTEVDQMGIRPESSEIRFDVDDTFYYGGDGAVTVVVDYYDVGKGNMRLDYDASGSGAGSIETTNSVPKMNSGRLTSAAFYIDDPGFTGGLDGADFRIVDEDSKMIIEKVILQKGRLKLPSVVMQQWRSRADSLATRLDFFPFTWDMLRGHPFGVGPFNTPGTDHHAIDSLPLTWMIEFGWPGLLLIGGLAFIIIREGIRVYRWRSIPVTVLYLSLLLVLLHGGHLMIIYDKPTLVLFSTIGAVYACVRPGRRESSPDVDIGRGCML